VNTTHPHILTPGQVFAGFKIIRVLGAGGMGTVYLAAHPRLPRENALKVLPKQFSDDPLYRARFEREAELAAELSHPHIVRIHDRGEYEGQFWLSMDYVAGTDAARSVREGFPGGMPLAEALPIISAVASALDFAHQRGLLHRDVKPANILLAQDDGPPQGVYLADFGIARRIDDAISLTATNVTVGTVDYAAPEQLKGESVDGRADQYALACTAFHLLTGTPPYGDSNSAVVISQHVSAPAPSIGVLHPHLAELDWVFAVAMAKDPSRRFTSCREFTDHLSRPLVPGAAYAGEIPGSTCIQYHPQSSLSPTSPALPVLPPTIAHRQRRRPRLLVGALLGVALLIAGAVFTGLKLSTRQHPTAVVPTSTAPTTSLPVSNVGPFTGTYQVELAVPTGLDGETAQTPLTPTTELWSVRSVCGSAGCVATASRQSGVTMQVPTMVLDQVGGSWVAVSTGSSVCAGAKGEVWETVTLQPLPGGGLSGEATQSMSKGCANKRTVTFSRTGDADLNSLPDPAALPPRVVSPAAALHGHYHERATQPNGYKENRDFAARTDCLRTGARCLSVFHTAPVSVMLLIYNDGTWSYNREDDDKCWKDGAMAHVKYAVTFALPQPPQDPITLLAGSGREEILGSSCPNTDVDVQFSRTGD
jgi:serine/threonine protein kinase